jgi:hypothetical protein
MAFPRGLTDVSRGLLPVVLQNLVASGTDLGTMLLETGQDGEITLIDHGTAELLHVTVTGLLLLRRSAARLLLGEGLGRNRYREQAECEEKFTHRFPSFRQQESCSPICTRRHRRNGFVWMAGAAKRGDEQMTSTVNADKFTATFMTT